MTHADPWDEQWRIDAANGVIVPGSVVRTGKGWATLAKPTPAPSESPIHAFTVEVFIVLARVPAPEKDDNGQRIGWDDVFLLEAQTGCTGWWQLDPANPESIVMVRNGMQAKDD